MKTIKLSTLRKTWIIDIDGVIFIHNGHLSGEDKPVKDIKSFLKKIPKGDFILILTARDKKCKKITNLALKKYDIRYDQIIYDVPVGERVLINDKKPKGLKTAISINTKRDRSENINFIFSKDI